MKIAYLINTYPRPSLSFVRREIQALERMGHVVVRLAMRSDRSALVDPDDLSEDRSTEHILEWSVRQLLLSGALAWRSPRRAVSSLRLAMACGLRGAGGGSGTGGCLRHLIYWAEAAAVARRCRALGVQHLHAHFGTNSATVAMLARALGGVRWSFTAHGPDEFDAPRAMSLEAKLLSADFAVAVSSFGRSQLLRWTPPDRWWRVVVVHCGIEATVFPAVSPLPAGGPLLIAVGRFVPQKGLLLLIDAIANVADDLPDLRLVLVGDGPLRAEIAQAVQRNGLEGRVLMEGWLAEAGVLAAMARAQVLVMPSFAEGLPVVIMEAMASGRPVVATAIAGIPELVIAGETGWLVPAGDVAALEGVLRELAARSVEQLSAMGREARARALERHDVDAQAARLAEMFEWHAARPGGPEKPAEES